MRIMRPRMPVKPHNATQPCTCSHALASELINALVLRYTTAMSVTLYHNPRCSKSRQTLALLKERGIEPRVVEYLVNPPSAAELGAILDRLGLPPRALLRTGEAAYRSAGLDDQSLTREQLIAAMVANPSVI